MQWTAKTLFGLGGHAWEQIALPIVSKESILLNLCNSAPISRSSQLVVIHDLSVIATPQSFSASYKTFHQFLMNRLIRSNSVLATVSEFSASEMMRIFGKGPKRQYEIIYEGGEHILRTPPDRGILDRLNLADRRFVLAVGSHNPNKNMKGLLQAVSLLDDLDIKVVATGGTNQRVFAGALTTDNGLIRTGHISDPELRALYEAAECFVFPSFYEGFGLPPLEAMHCGCPVAVSNRASLPEVCGDAALYFDPSDPHDIAKQLRAALTSRSLRADMRAAGLARAGKFTWRAAANALEDILDRRFASPA
jgi:glycosyltransferase involved in cell wall biosynthesis